MSIEKLLFDISNEPLVILRNGILIRKVNKAFIKLTGCGNDRLCNTSFLDSVHEDDVLPAMLLLKMRMEPGFNSQILRWKTSSGQIKTFNFIVENRLRNETLIRLQDHELYQKKEAETFINEQVLHLILDLVPYPVFVKNSKFQYILLNQAQAKLFGLTAEEMLGRKDDELIKNKEELALVKKTDREVMDSLRKVVLAEQHFTTPNGNNYILQTIKVPFINAVTSEKNILGVSIDYTERKRAQDELIKTNFELDTFVYRASHDLKAPLRSVMGLVNLLKIDQSAENRNTCVEKIESSILKLNEFIKDLTDYSRNARLEVQSQMLDLEETFYSILDSLKYLDPVKKVNIEVKISSGATFASDKHRLEVIFQNILSNSFKYQNPHNHKPRIRITGTVSEKEAVIEIRDNGIGIKKEYQAGVYNMFYRATEFSEGSGLGLYIAKQSIEKLQGQISFKSEENRGTTFKLQFKNLFSST